MPDRLPPFLEKPSGGHEREFAKEIRICPLLDFARVDLLNNRTDDFRRELGCPCRLKAKSRQDSVRGPVGAILNEPRDPDGVALWFERGHGPRDVRAAEVARLAGFRKRELLTSNAIYVGASLHQEPTESESLHLNIVG